MPFGLYSFLLCSQFLFSMPPESFSQGRLFFFFSFKLCSSICPSVHHSCKIYTIPLICLQNSSWHLRFNSSSMESIIFLLCSNSVFPLVSFDGSIIHSLGCKIQELLWFPPDIPHIQSTGKLCRGHLSSVSRIYLISYSIATALVPVLVIFA